MIQSLLELLDLTRKGDPSDASSSTCPSATTLLAYLSVNNDAAFLCSESSCRNSSKQFSHHFRCSTISLSPLSFLSTTFFTSGIICWISAITPLLCFVWRSFELAQRKKKTALMQGYLILQKYSLSTDTSASILLMSAYISVLTSSNLQQLGVPSTRAGFMLKSIKINRVGRSVNALQQLSSNTSNMGKLMGLLLLSLLTVSTYQDGVDLLEELDLTYYMWKLYDDNGFSSFLTFQTSKTVGLSTNPNIATWSLNAQHVLSLSGPKGVMVKFVVGMQDYFGKWRLEGRVLNTATFAVPEGWKMYLEQLL